MAAVHDGDHGSAAAALAYTALNKIVRGWFPADDVVKAFLLINAFFDHTAKQLKDSDEKSSVSSVVAVCTATDVCVGWVGDCEAGIFFETTPHVNPAIKITGKTVPVSRIVDYEGIPWYKSKYHSKYYDYSCSDAANVKGTDKKIARNWPLHTFFRTSIFADAIVADRIEVRPMYDMNADTTTPSANKNIYQADPGKVYSWIPLQPNTEHIVKKAMNVAFMPGSGSDECVAEQSYLNASAKSKQKNPILYDMTVFSPPQVDDAEVPQVARFVQTRLSGSMVDATRAMGKTGSDWTIDKQCMMQFDIAHPADGDNTKKRFLLLCSKGASRAFGGVGHLARFCNDPLEYIRTTFYKSNGRWDIDLKHIAGIELYRKAILAAQSVITWDRFIAFILTEHLEITGQIFGAIAGSQKQKHACSASMQWLMRNYPAVFPWGNHTAIATIAVHVAVLMGCDDNATVLFAPLPSAVEASEPQKGLAVAHVTNMERQEREHAASFNVLPFPAATYFPPSGYDVLNPHNISYHG